MGILEQEDGLLNVKTLTGNSKFILIITVPDPYPVLSSGGQIHTNQASLERSIKKIQDLRKSFAY